MIKLGEMQELEIVRKKEFGVFLAEKADSEESVLLPAKQVPETAAVGDRINVFIYRDSKDRLIATTNTPKIRKGECAILKVSDVTKIGAFLDMGLEKELLLPFKEQNHPVRIGEECLVALYIDKSGRLAATMKVYPYLSAESPYKKEDKVEGRVYEVNEDMGVFVAVDDRYFGLIPRSEVYENFAPGEHAAGEQRGEKPRVLRQPRQRAPDDDRGEGALRARRVLRRRGSGGGLSRRGAPDKADPRRGGLSISKIEQGPDIYPAPVIITKRKIINVLR